MIFESIARCSADGHELGFFGRVHGEFVEVVTGGREPDTVGVVVIGRNEGKRL